MQSNSDVLTAQEAAAFLKANIETIRRLARRGAIPAFKVGKDWRFHKESLMRWIEGRLPHERNNLVLIVDDEEQICRTFNRILARDGYETECAANGLEAMEIISRAKAPPSVILLDLVMPGMNGPEFLKRLRQTYSELPVVIVTAYPDSDLLQQASQYAPVMLLCKPVAPALLRRTVKTVMAAESSRI